MRNNLLELNHRLTSPLGAEKPFRRKVLARVCFPGGGRSANR